MINSDSFKVCSIIFECLFFGLKNRGLLILLLPDVSPASVAGIFRGLGSQVVARNLLDSEQQPQEPSPLKMPATDAGETSGRRSISIPRFLRPKSKHSNISAHCESLNQYISTGNSFSFFVWIYDQIAHSYLQNLCSATNYLCCSSAGFPHKVLYVMPRLEAVQKESIAHPRRL